MELRRSVRLAAKRDSQNVPVSVNKTVNGTIYNNNQKVLRTAPESLTLKKNKESSFSEQYVNFVVYGLFKMDIEDPKAEGLKKRVGDFLLLFMFFCAIKFVFWYLDVLQYN